MTSNKIQGQTLNNIGLYFQSPVFSHGQLYIVLSQLSSNKPEGLKILIKNIDKEEQEYTENIVYKEIFNNLQKVKTTSIIFLIINIIINNTVNHLQNPVSIW